MIFLHLNFFKMCIHSLQCHDILYLCTHNIDMHENKNSIYYSGNKALRLNYVSTNYSYTNEEYTILHQWTSTNKRVISLSFLK